MILYKTKESKVIRVDDSSDEINITVDSELSLESENPIQNKAITKCFNDLESTVGAIRLTKEYITEHNTLTSFISGLKENTCYIFYGAQAARSEMTILHNIGLIPKYGEGFLKILCSLNHYSINVEYNNTDRRIISYNPTVLGNYQLSDWYSLATTEDTVSHATNADNADTVDGYHVNDSATASPYGKIPRIDTNGVMEVGKYIDFHISTVDSDNDARITANNDKIEISKPIESPSVNTSSLTINKNFSGYGSAPFVVQNPTYPNAKIQACVDQEGANFRLQTNEENNYFELDTLGNNLRLYHYYKGKTPTLITSSGSGENLELNINGTAAKATKDSDGNVIKDTYLNTQKISGVAVIGRGNNSKGIAICQTYGAIGLYDNHGNVMNGILVESSQVTPFDWYNNNAANISLGSSGRAWSGIYSRTGVTNISDEREKENIKEVDLDLTNQLIEKIRAVTYRLKINESGRTHYGMISQQIEEVLEELGISSKDFAAFIKSPVTENILEQAKDQDENPLFDDNGEPIMIKVGEKETGDYTYMLRYNEFIPILWKNAQDKNQIIKELQYSNQEIRNKIKDLERRILELESHMKDTI